jgi:CelD/BcsL family acetyltransferase involved in cellulose biosynthesis
VRSVGTVVLSAALEDAFERGLDEFDFLRGLEVYKDRYTCLRRPLATLRVMAGLRPEVLWLADRGRHAVGMAGRPSHPPCADTAVAWQDGQRHVIARRAVDICRIRSQGSGCERGTVRDRRSDSRSTLAHFGPREF